MDRKTTKPGWFLFGHPGLCFNLYKEWKNLKYILRFIKDYTGQRHELLTGWWMERDLTPFHVRCSVILNKTVEPCSYLTSGIFNKSDWCVIKSLRGCLLFKNVAICICENSQARAILNDYSVQYIRAIVRLCHHSVHTTA